MKLKWKTLQTVLLLALVCLAGVGCGGLAAAPTISPLTFLLPGFAQNDTKPAGEQPAEAPEVKPPVSTVAAVE